MGPHALRHTQRSYPSLYNLRRTALQLVGIVLLFWGNPALASSAIRQTRPWQRSIHTSVAEALRLNDEGNREEKLAVIVLSQDPKQLCCALKNWSAHVFVNTPADVYIFSLDSNVEETLSKDCTLKRSPFFSITFMRLNEHWETPNEAGDPSLWTDQAASADYRRMGHWRLTFQMEFAASLGHKYVLQLDDDSAFPHVIDFNLLHQLAERDVWMAARTILPVDSGSILQVTVGLAELARFFLVTERMQPTLLYAEDCDPPNITGLFTPEVGGTGKGYSTRYLYGNFVIVSLDFWFQERVQRFVRLVLGTGAHFRFRWNEQQVQSIIWQMFVPLENFLLYTFDYDHPVKSWHVC